MVRTGDQWSGALVVSVIGAHLRQSAAVQFLAGRERRFVVWQRGLGRPVDAKVGLAIARWFDIGGFAAATDKTSYLQTENPTFVIEVRRGQRYAVHNSLLDPHEVHIAGELILAAALPPPPPTENFSRPGTR
jgi:hypothetical protein